MEVKPGSTKHNGAPVRSGRQNCVVVSANAFWNIANFRAGLIHALAREGFRVIIAAPEPDAKWSNRQGVETASITVDRSGLNPFADARLFGQYCELFVRERASVYLGFTVKPNIYGALASRWSGTSAIPNVSGLGTAFIAGGPLSWIVTHLYRIAFRNCPTIFFQNTDDCELFVARKIVRRSQCRLLPGSGVDLEHFKPAPYNHSQPLCFLLIARLLGDKGVREFVQAARMLKSQEPGWRFQLLGPVDEANRTAISHEELDGWVAEGVVEYLGSAADVRPFIAEASAVVLPSYREGMPRTLLEASAMARPLIATDVPGNRQLVQDSVNGLLCSPCDWQSLAQAMLAMGRKAPQEREAIGAAARNIVSASYGEDRVISAYLDAVRQLQPVVRV